MPISPRRLAVLLCLGVSLSACHSPDPKQELDLTDLETYWAVDRKVGETHYIAPVVRFRLRHKGAQEHRSIQATATFRRVGEEVTWGSAWAQVNPVGQPFRPGQETLVVLMSDARYTCPDPPETMLQNQEFKDARVDVFLRAGSSQWVKFTEVNIERRIGSRSVEGIVAPETTPPAE
jgi:hypothetical protein